MPIDAKAMLKGLKPVLKALDADLLVRAKDPGVETGLKVSWEREKAASRTAANFNLWKRRRCSQVSIAWVLSVVFVRTLEDRDFLARRRIAGVGAQDSERQFTAIAPFLTARDYLLTVFRELAKLPGAGDLFDARHNPVWVLAPSADVARQLLDFFRQTDAEGELVHSFDGTDTRFLGDLYQNLSEDVRKRFALLQTPDFVEEFILEQTLDPAVAAFGLSEVRLIDPTCGSGHFLLGAFHRLFDAWQAEAPGEDRQVLAQRAIAQVYGCDLNPYAVAIARFRLTLEFLQVTGITRLERAPRLPLNLCVADSLLHGVAGQQMRMSGAVDTADKAAWGDALFALEDEAEALRILGQRYHAVVGNPPYITEKDAKKRAKYRDLYESASGKYALAAPFTERFFGLAVPAGFVGLINANSFTKRDFGKTLITEVLPRLDVSKVVDTSGAYIPGHGTPTLLLFGRNRAAGTDDVTAVLGKRGEAEEPADAATAPVWSEINGHHDDMGFDGRYVSVEPIPREQMAQHPWVLAGGGARGLKERIESALVQRLHEMSDSVGIMVVTGEDDVFLQPPSNVRRVRPGDTRPLVEGTNIRDWEVAGWQDCLWMYSINYEVKDAAEIEDAIRHLTPYRTTISKRKRFGVPMLERGFTWYELQELYYKKLHTPLSITFAFVATHNHFVLDRGGKVFKQSAPIIKLKEQYDEDDHLALLGLLNSSVACFWMKMMFFGKHMGDGGSAHADPAYQRFEFDGTKLKMFPIVSNRSPLPYARRLTELAEGRKAFTSEAVLESDGWSASGNLRVQLDKAHQSDLNTLFAMVGVQEELDWLCYRLYGIESSTTVSPESAPRLIPGHRAFEVALAQADRTIRSEIDSGRKPQEPPTAWFERHGWSPSTQPPNEHGQEYRNLVLRRMELIEAHQSIRLLESQKHKRRWHRPDYSKQDSDALQSYLLDRIESLLESQAQPAAMSARQLAAELQRDAKAQAVAEVYTGETAPDLERLVTELVKAEGVPYLAALRYTDTGLEKHAAWRETWDLQRREDAGEDVGDIPVPPKYATKDFRRSEYWTHRGKLDVPKERFVLYPGAETDNDSSPWLGWAGWDHLQKATALSGLYQHRKTEEGWDADKLTPLLAGLDELVPWLVQWHNEPNAAYGNQRLGDFFGTFVAAEAHGMALSTADLQEWRPPEPVRGRSGRARRSA